MKQAEFVEAVVGMLERPVDVATLMGELRVERDAAASKLAALNRGLQLLEAAHNGLPHDMSRRGKPTPERLVSAETAAQLGRRATVELARLAEAKGPGREGRFKRKCEICGKAFRSKRSWARYDTPRCARKAHTAAEARKRKKRGEEQAKAKRR